MYSFRYRFYPREKDKAQYYDTVLSSFLAALLKNGQIVGEWNIADTGDCFELACLAPDEDSLDAKYYNSYVKYSLSPLLARCSQKPEYSMVGPAVGLDPTCKCESPSSYVLYTNFLQVEPPVLCGDCGGRVPLYRLPHLGDELDYAGILTWEESYKACDTLYMLSGVGEDFGQEQVGDPDSELTENGLSICKDLSAKTGKPFYYFLNASECPDAEWKSVAPIAGMFDLVCEQCGLVSLTQDHIAEVE